MSNQPRTFKLPPPPYQIWVVDDDQSVRHLVVGFVKKAGHEVVAECQNGDEFLKECEGSKRMDIVILDYLLPGTNGFQIATEMVKRRKAPILFISTTADDARMQEWQDLLFKTDLPVPAQFIKKPLDFDQFRLTLPALIVAFARQEAAIKEQAKLTERLRERVVIEQAKGRLLRQNSQITEDDAFQVLKFVSKEQKVSIKELAEAVLHEDSSVMQSLTTHLPQIIEMRERKEVVVQWLRDKQGCTLDHAKKAIGLLAEKYKQDIDHITKFLKDLLLILQEEGCQPPL